MHHRYYSCATHSEWVFFSNLVAIFRKVQGMPITSIFADKIAQDILDFAKEVDELQTDFKVGSTLVQHQ